MIKDLNTFSPKVGNKAVVSAFTTSILYCIIGLSQCIKGNKRNKKVSKFQGELPLFADDTMIYKENPKESTKKKKSELINKLSMIARYRANIHINKNYKICVRFLY